MGVISGRYGAAQRILPSGYNSDGTVIWGAETNITDPTKWGIPALPAITGGADSGLASAGGGSMISSMTSWTMEDTVAPITYQASNTRGYQGKLAGARSCTGNLNGLGGIPPIAPGQRFRFYGFTGPTNGQLDNTIGTVYRIAAIANSVAINISYERTTPITWSVGWQSDWQVAGDELVPFSDPTSTVATDKNKGFWDYTKPPCETLMPSDTCLMVVNQKAPNEAGYDPVAGRINACFQTANIQFSTEVATYVNSCSAAAGGWQAGTIGTTNCTVAAQVHGDNYNIFRTNHLPGSNVFVRMYIEGGEIANEAACLNKAYWEFNKLFLGSYGGLNVDTASNAPLSFSVNMEFNAFPDCNYGYIRYNPGGGTNAPVDFISMVPPQITPP